METIKDLVLQIKRLPDCSPKKSESSNEISIYNGELSDKCLVSSIATIKKSFPALPIGFYDVFIDRLKANGFSDQRLRDAVANVVDNCIYPTPTVANFIGYDKKVKLNTYEDMLKKTNDFGPEIWNSYKQLMLPGRTKPVWVHVDEAKFFNV